MTLSVWLLLVMAAVMLGSVVLAEVTERSVYGSPVVLAALTLLTFLTALCCFSKRWLSFHGIGFLTCHIAVVLVFTGAFVWFITGTQGYVPLISGQTSYAGFSEKTGEAQPDFTVECTAFTVEYRYRCVYTYAAAEGTSYVEKGRVQRKATVVDGRFTFDESPVHCGSYGDVPASAFYGEDGNLKTQFIYGNLMLTLADETSSVKQYRADLAYSDGGTADISVNNPTTHKGWKIYLNSYGETFYSEDGTPHTRVTLQMKQDKGNPLAMVGLILCPLGTFLLCFRSRKSGGEEGESHA